MMKKNLRKATGRFSGWWTGFCLLLVVSLQAAYAVPPRAVAKEQGDLDMDKVFITIHMKKNSTIKDVFSAIEAKTEFRFFYDENIIKVDRELSLGRKNASLTDILIDISGAMNLKFRQVNQVINVNNRDSAGAPRVIKEEKTITGQVTSEGEPMGIPGVTVRVKGEGVGTVTDMEGRFTLQIPDEGAVLVISFIGYKTKEVIVGTQTTLDVVLEEDIGALDEVVVVGYGVQRKEQLTGAVSQVEAADFNKRPITNPTQALQGVASGVLVSQNSGEPGRDGGNINIRGIATFTGSNDPFVLVDGVPADFSRINPDDIESISVLKDASASAIYGSRAANGVILVTTKRGAEGQGSLTIDAYTGVQAPTRLPDLVTDPIQWMELHNLAREQPTREGNIPGPFYTDEMIAEYKSFMERTGFQGFDMFDALFSPAPISKINASLKGGTDKINYYLSGSYLTQKGVGKGSSYEQGNFRLNLDAKVNDWIRTGSSITASYGVNDRPSSQAGSDQFLWAWRWRPTAPAVFGDGSYGVRKFFQAGEWGPTWDNPIAYTENGVNQRQQLQTIGSVYLEIEPVKDLKIRGSASANMTQNFQTSYDPVLDFYYASAYYSESDPGTLSRASFSRNSNSLEKSTGKNYNTLLQLTADYTVDLGDYSSVDVLVGMSQELFRNDTLSASTSDFSQEGLYEIGDLNPENEQAGSEAGHLAFRSYFARSNLNIRDKYLFTVNFRADATSRFSPENRWGYFPSVSGGWIMSNEDFYDFGPMDFLKFRVSHGQLGNQDTGGRYLYKSSITTGGRSSYNFDNNLALGSGPSSIPNRDAVWEVSTKTDFGFETRWFSSMLTGSFTYFMENRSGQLLPQPIPTLAGDIDEPVKNLAEVDIWGWEIDLGFNKRFGDLQVGIRGNISHAQNKVVSIAEGIDQIVRGPSNTFLIRPGYPIDQPFLIQDKGLYRSDAEAKEGPMIAGGNTTAGDIAYVDQNGDGVIGGRNSIEDKVPVSRPYPNISYGFMVNLGYKNFDLSVQANGIAGVDYWAVYYGVEAFGAQGQIPKRYLKESYTFNKENPTLPRLVYQWNYSGNEGLAYPSTYSLHPGDYLRIKNINLGYTFPDDMVSRIGMQGLRIYANAQNPFLFTPLFNDADPERPLGNGGSLSFNRQPQVEIYSFGVKITL